MSQPSKNVNDSKEEWLTVGPSGKAMKKAPQLRKGRVGVNPPKFRKPRPVSERIGRLTLSDVAATASAAYKTGKYLFSLMNTEMKLGATTGSAVAVDYNGTIVNLSNIAQGTDITNRDGDSILLQYQRLALKVFNNIAATSGSYLRALIVRDNEQNGVDPVINDVLGTSGSSNVVLDDYNFFSTRPATNRKHRFEVMFDRVYRLTPTTDLTVHDTWSERYTAGNKHILYDASAAADASNREGALFLMLVSDQQTNTPIVDYIHTMHFTDN